MDQHLSDFSIVLRYTLLLSRLWHMCVGSDSTLFVFGRSRRPSLLAIFTFSSIHRQMESCQRVLMDFLCLLNSIMRSFIMAMRRLRKTRVLKMRQTIYRITARIGVLASPKYQSLGAVTANVSRKVTQRFRKKVVKELSDCVCAYCESVMFVGQLCFKFITKDEVANVVKNSNHRKRKASVLVR